MSKRDRSSKCSKNTLSLILHAAEVLETTGAAPGPSGMSEQLTALPGSPTMEFAERHEQSLAVECYQDSSDSDTDIDKDSASLSSVSVTSESLASSSWSKIRNHSRSSLEEEPALQKRSSRNVTGRRGGRAKMFPQSMAELVRKQEDANEKHNKNERERRKDMTFSVSELRSQLSKPTRRGSMKMVLEAAIEELKELEGVENRNAEIVESLKDKQKRLTFELENKLKEYEKHKQSKVDGHPAPPCPPPLVYSGVRYPSPSVVTPIRPITPGMPGTHFSHVPSPIGYPRSSEMSSLPSSFHPPINPCYPFLMPTLTRYVPTQSSQMVQEQSLVSSPQFNLGMRTNSPPVGLYNPFLPGCPRMGFPHPVTFPPFYNGLMPSQIPTVPYPSFSAHVPSMQTLSPPVSSPGQVRIPGFEALPAISPSPTSSSESLRVNEPLRVSTIRGMPLLSSPTQTRQSGTHSEASPDSRFYRSNSNTSCRDNRHSLTPSAGPSSFRGASKSEHKHTYSDLESSTSVQEEVDTDERTCPKNRENSAEAVDTMVCLSKRSPTTVSADLTSSRATNTNMTGSDNSNQGEDGWGHSRESGRPQHGTLCVSNSETYSRRYRHRKKSSFGKACSKAKSNAAFENSSLDDDGLRYQFSPPPLSSDLSIQDEQAERRIRKVPNLLKMAEHRSVPSENRSSAFDVIYSHAHDVNNIETTLPVTNSRINTNLNFGDGPYGIANKTFVSSRETESERSNPEETNILPDFNPQAAKKRKCRTITGFLPVDSDGSESETTMKRFNPGKRVREAIETCSANYKSHGKNTPVELYKAGNLGQVIRMQSVRSNNTSYPFPSMLDTVAVATN